MRLRQSSLACGRVAFLALAVLILSGNIFATTEKVVYSFLDQPDGVTPNGGLVADAAGNLYGTTTRGGTDFSCTCGTVFELSPPTTAGGAWTESILYSFQGGNADGETPVGTLILDAAGNLYGTTRGGFNNNSGAVFELSPPTTAGGAWTETILWVFSPNGRNGASPSGKLAMDAAGDLYGTAGGGTHSGGVVFELIKPKTSGQLWSERVLYNFGAFGSDGTNPAPSVIFRNGVIYGSTLTGGSNNEGIVFQLVRNSGVWTENILHNFNGTDGLSVYGGLILDSAGNLYGAAQDGGNTTICASGCGTIFELSPPAVAGDPWQETTLYTFTSHGDGANPIGGLWRDKLGNLYGTASQGGKKNTTGAGGATLGTVFKLKAPAVSGGAWTLVVLHDFGGFNSGGDGNFPYSELTQLNGLLYGTTDLGGNEFSNGGTVFSVVP